MKDFETALQSVFTAKDLEERKLYISKLYESFYDKLFSMAYAVKKDEKLCEDAVQNVILKLLTTDKSIFPTKNQTAWLYSVIKNKVKDLAKKENRALSGLDLERINFSEKSIDDYLDMENFNSLIKDLDERRRKIVTLKIVGGYTHKEISRILGEKQSTVRWLYCTAIKSLKHTVYTLLSAFILSFLGFAISGMRIYGVLDSFLPPIVYPNDGAASVPAKLSSTEIFFLVCIALTIILSIFLIIFLSSEHRKKK